MQSNRVIPQAPAIIVDSSLAIGGVNFAFNDGFVMDNSPVVKLTILLIFVIVYFSFLHFDIFNVVQKSLSCVTYMIVL